MAVGQGHGPLPIRVGSVAASKVGGGGPLPFLVGGVYGTAVRVGSGGGPLPFVVGGVAYVPPTPTTAGGGGYWKRGKDLDFTFIRKKAKKKVFPVAQKELSALKDVNAREIEFFDRPMRKRSQDVEEDMVPIFMLLFDDY